jgi:hypothetical protein
MVSLALCPRVLFAVDRTLDTTRPFGHLSEHIRGARPLLRNFPPGTLTPKGHILTAVRTYY